ncbi:acetyl-coenzyme A synthetase N-terminal domain-containing protein, partial [Rhodococcus erythropolis]
MSSSEQASHTTYADAYRESMDQPEKFWLDAARAVDWDVAPTRALDDSAAPIYRWFPNASLNTSFNALDRHVRDGRGDQTALIFDSAMVP